MTEIPENHTSHLERPSWDELYMTLACVYAMRSPDPATRHGAVIVSSDNRPIAFGYNGHPKGGRDDSVYPTTRPEKYKTVCHSELNALLNRTMNAEGGTVYVTGPPCSACVIAMIQGGIKKIVYGQIQSTCVDRDDWEMVLLMAENCDIELCSYEGECPRDVLDNAKEYLFLKKWDIYDAPDLFWRR